MVKEVRDDVSWKYLVMATSPVRFSTTIYCLTANDTITTVPIPTGAPILRNNHSNIITQVVHIHFSVVDE